MRWGWGEERWCCRAGVIERGREGAGLGEGWWVERTSAELAALCPWASLCKNQSSEE